MRKSNRRKVGSGEASVQNSYLGNLVSEEAKFRSGDFGQVRSDVRPFCAARINGLNRNV
jgi:hypothetical protein